MKEKLHIIIKNALSPQCLEREIAFFVDIVICLTLGILPRIGGILALGYFLLKDTLPWSNNMSLGKSIYKLRVVSSNEGHPAADWKQSILRNLITFLPPINLYDVYLFLTTGERLSDAWVETSVIKEESTETIQQAD